MRNNAFAQWAIQGFSVLAFLILLMYLCSFLPQDGPLGSVRKILTMGH